MNELEFDIAMTTTAFTTLQLSVQDAIGPSNPSQCTGQLDLNIDTFYLDHENEDEDVYLNDIGTWYDGDDRHGERGSCPSSHGTEPSSDADVYAGSGEHPTILQEFFADSVDIPRVICFGTRIRTS